MYPWRIAAATLACAAVCLCQDATEPTANPSPSTADVTVTSPPTVTVTSPPAVTVTSPPAVTGSAVTSATASAATGVEGSTSAGDTATPAAPVTSPPSDVITAGSTTVGGGAEEDSAAEEVTTTGAPEATVAPPSAAATVESTSSAPETTMEPAVATSAKASAGVTTTVAPSIAEAVTTAAPSVATSAETVAESTAVSSSETTLAPSAEAAETAGTTVAAEAVETTVAVEITQTTEAPDATSSQSAATPTPTTLAAATSAEVTAPVTSAEVTAPVTHPPSSPASAEPAEETSSAESVSTPHTTAAASSATDISTTETATPPLEYYGYPRSMTVQEMGIPEMEGAVTLLLSPRRMSFLAWMGLKESALRSAILNITRDNGFNSSDLEWVYISPTPTCRSPDILLSFLIVWRGGGGPAEGTVTPNSAVPSSPAASRSSGYEPATGADSTATTADDSPPVTPSVTPVTSDPAVTLGSRRRRAVSDEEGGMVPAEWLRRIITDNADQLSNMVSADLVLTSTGLEASPNACSRQDESFMATNGSIMLALSVAAGICLCLTCGALLYVRLIRDSGHWEPQPAYHEGERVGGLDLHSDNDCKKGEEPPDGTGAEVYPLSSVSITPRGSLRGDDRV